MISFNKRERVLLFLTIAIVVSIATVFLLLPMMRSYQRLGVEQGNQERQLAAYRRTIEQVPQWQAEYDALRDRLGQRIEQYEEMSEVLKKIEEVAQGAGVIIQQRRPLLKNDRGVYVEFPVACRLEATTDSLVKFLFGLRTGSGFVSVEKLEVLSQPNSNVLRCDVEIRALAGKSERSSL